MNLKLFLIISFGCFVFTPQIVEAGWLFGPSNYDECILEYIKNSKSNYAITKIKKACHYKFYVPKKKKKPEEPFDASKIDWELLEAWSKEMCDCILDNMKDVDSNRAAKLIYKSCADKTGEWRYPPKRLAPTYKKNEPKGKKKLIEKNGKYYYVPTE